VNVYESFIKENVRRLRISGLSLGEIQKRTNIPKTTIQLWTKDILQSEEQQMLIKMNVLEGLQAGYMLKSFRNRRG
jgi:hypothetical protein